MGHGAEDSEDEGGAPTRPETVATKPKKLKSKKPMRSNFEATSDEDED
jgi:hypothetical protein